MKRYPVRRPKDYRWEAHRAEGTLSEATVLTDVICQPSNAFITGAREHLNLQRILGTVTLSVVNDDLLSISTALYTRCSWMILLVDNDDATAYDPEASDNLQDEVVLAHGETEYFGYGTTQSLLVAGGGVVLAQTAVCMAYAQIKVDVRTNRKIENNNQHLGLYITRPPFNEISDDLDVSYESTFRTLLKKP